MSGLVSVVDETRLGLSRQAVTDLVEAVLKEEGAEGAVVVVFVETPVIERVNLQFRGVAEPTDVLSFAYQLGDTSWPDPDRVTTNASMQAETPPDLGEVICCPEVVCRYADEEGRSLSHQLTWTIVHGILHLLGYDHEEDDGEMRKREQELLRRVDHLRIAVESPARG